jgi:hypothetical protein
MSRLIIFAVIVAVASSDSPRNLIDNQEPAALPDASNEPDSESQSLKLGENFDMLIWWKLAFMHGPPHLFLSSTGQKISLDRLGPAIVNKDGTLRRISNWDQLTPSEQAVAFRRISQRNQQRLASLQQENKQGMKREPENSIPSDQEASPNSSTSQVYSLTASDFVLLALLATVLIFVLPSKIYRMIRRLSARKQSTKSD